MTRKHAIAIYSILVAECNAPDIGLDRDAFVRYMTDGERGKEWRFQGSLGFGGKCRYTNNRDTPYVTCYPEDETTARLSSIDRANARIAELFA